MVFEKSLKELLENAQTTADYCNVADIVLQAYEKRKAEEEDDSLQVLFEAMRIAKMAEAHAEHAAEYRESAAIYMNLDTFLGNEPEVASSYREDVQRRLKQCLFKGESTLIRKFGDLKNACNPSNKLLGPLQDKTA